MKIFTIKKKPVVDIEEQRREKLTELGSGLKEARLSQGVSLEGVAQKTRIQKRLLAAIEEGNPKPLPEPVYIRELIRQFANTLGLDGEQLASSFPIESQRKPVSGRKSWFGFIRALPGLTGFNLRASHLYILYVVLVVFAVQQISELDRPSHLQASNREDIKSVAPPPKAQKPPSTSVELSSRGQNKPDKPVVVNITVKDETWVMVTVDGKKDFEGTLTKGTHRTWAADQQLTILTGNAGGVMVAFKDEKAKQLGKPGQVQKVTFQANAGS
jgi:cytoskeletal protein RodZ